MDTRYETPWGIFAWDEEKRKKNIHKHGIDFYAAAEVFRDECHVEQYDATHSDEEERWLALGTIHGMRVVVTCFTERDMITRIFSARKATREERIYYEQYKYLR